MSKKINTKVKYVLDKKGTFHIENYNQSKSFSNFFPGIAGLWGVPMWVFYVNRGQCVASFGIQSKDKAIMEFQPANKSYRAAALQGFRTFIKLKRGRKAAYWEPFQNNLLGTDFKKDVKMSITAHDLTLEEKNEDLGLVVKVNYFTLPDEPFAALVRKVSVKNIGKEKCDVEIVDGLPLIIPYGLSDWINKNMSRTVEAWVKVRNLENKAPYYQLNVEVADTPRVTHIKEGNFYFAFDPASKSQEPLPAIVEAEKVFGQAFDFTAPEAFLNDGYDAGTVQKTDNKMPSAMTYCSAGLAKGKTQDIVSVTGYAREVKQLNEI
ncbi:MAG: hypothetical protein KC618_03240, partial [Candidatus Omnitrophica bacterium]|nr:hypothetical protein [Candidatus Omnitrophota bacterium]